MKARTQFNRVLLAVLLLLTPGIGPFSSLPNDPPRAEAQRLQAAPTAQAEQSSEPAQLPQVTAASTVVQVGQWVTVTLTHGQPGHQGFFDAEIPLHYQRADGQPCTAGFACVTIDALGQAQVLAQASAESDAAIYFTDTSTDQIIPASVRVRFYEGVTAPPPPLQDSKPQIQSVTPGYSPISGPYLIGLGNQVANRVSVTTDMGGQRYSWPYMLVSVNGKVWVRNSICDRDNGVCEFDLPFDNGSNQYAPLQVGDNTLKVIVGTNPFSPDDIQSDPYSFVVTAVQAPEWLSALNPTGDIHLTSDGSNLAYEMTVELPAMNWLAPTFISSGGSNGTALGQQTSGVGHIIPCKKHLIDKTINKSFAGKVYGIDLAGDATATGKLDAELEKCKIWNPELVGTVTANGDIRASKSWNLYSLLSDYFDSSTAAAIVVAFTPLPKYLDVSLSGEMDASLESQFTIRPSKPYVRADLKATSKLDVNGTGDLVVAVPIAYVHFSLNGAGNASFAMPNVTNFNDLTLKANLGYEVRTWGIISVVPFDISCQGQFSYPPGSSSKSCSGWLSMSHIEHSFDPNYATFQATPGKAQAFSRAVEPNQLASGTITSVLVSDVYTYTQAALAASASSDHALALWVHDVPPKPFGTSTELYFSQWDGATWSSPAAVTDDDVMDGMPRLAWTSENQAVTVWQRMAQSLPLTATIDITTTNLYEVASAVYDATANTWSPPILLTDNSVADVSPQLARNSNGQLLATWLQNDYGEFIGDDTHPSRLMAAFYNGAWGVPMIATDPAVGVTGLGTGYGNGQATIAFTRWFTPTGALEATNQLFATTWNGNVWSVPQQLTYDTLNHMNPNVIYNDSNQPILVWHTSDTLRLHNLQDGTVAAVRLPDEIGNTSQLHVVQDAAGNIMALFTANREQQDLYLAYYDRAHNLWGLPRRLTDDIHIEPFADLALDLAGRPLAVYPVILQDLVTRTMTLSDGTTVTFTVPTDRQTDLVTLSRTLNRNVAVDALSVSDPRPVPGSKVMISAQVRNAGDLPIDGLAVSFYDGDPSAGRALIGMSTRAWPLTSGFTATLSVPYAVPATGGPRTLYAIADPANVIAESDKSDNQASLSAFGPDLDLADIQVRYPYGSIGQVRTVVRNLGAGTSPATTLAYYKDAVTGTLLLTQTIPALAYGESVTMVGSLDMSTLAEGEYNLYAVFDSHGWVTRDVGTKQRQFALIIGPDIMVSPYSLWATPLTGSAVRLTAMVYNVGPITATNVSVSFRTRPESDGGTPLATRTIAALPPGQAVRVSADVSDPLACGLYAYLENDNGRYENRRGNVAAVGGSSVNCQTIYLPIVWRQ